MFYCYILLCSDDSFYVGVTDDLARRTEEHNDGKGADWTAARRPVRLVWFEQHPTLSSARQRENQLKRWSREKKAALVEGSLRLRSGQGP
ncbi:MAG: GIY-YIG nuclease family protein [Candidatus Acidiferrales bacterium]|jgi:putative endonuclease